MILTHEEREQKIRQLAYNWWEIRQRYGIKSTAEDDWNKAIEIVDNDYPYKIKVRHE